MAAVPPQSDIEQALRDRNFAWLRGVFGKLEPADVADCIDMLEPGDRAVAFRVMNRDLASETFEYLEPESQEGLIKGLAREQVATILNDMAPDDRTEMLEELPAAATKQVLSLLSVDERAIARKLLGYPEESIGRLMTPDYMAIRSNWTVQQSLDHIRQHGEDRETLNVINIVDDRGLLIDDLRVRQLLLADPQSKVSEISDGHFVALRAKEDQENAIQVFKEYDRVAFPVIDSKGVLLGIVTVDDVLDVAEEEATEDIQKIGGTAALEQPYMQISLFEMLRKRAVWLVVLFLGQLLTLNAMGYFAEKIAETVVLMLFIPLIISSGGNSGSQAATLVVRAMALGELELSDWWRVMRREVLVGLIMGVVLSSIGIVRIGLGESLGGGYGADWGRVALAVGASLTVVVLWGVVTGSMLPFLLRRLGADPATSSTPFVATIVDVTGLIIYLTLATMILT
ncbi:MAG: magnesium transporter [bacterium]|nr:magnesium transporter [bacterium]